jgi:hypothetical protein
MLRAIRAERERPPPEPTPTADQPLEIPARFTEFCHRTLRVQLTPGQRVLCLVAFDGIEPQDLEGSDRELARQIFGDVDSIPPGARNVIVAMCGARAGKSYVLSALRLLHAALTVSLETMAPGEVAAAVVVTPDGRLGRQVLRYAKGAAKGAAALAKLIEGETAESLTIRRPDGEVVEIVCLPATRGGSAVRGRSLVGAVLDEAAFFRDADYAINDDEIFKAVAPRVLVGGQVVISSTPWAEAGLLWKLYDENHGEPVTALAAHAPTLLLRDDEHTREFVERERERDPDNAAREFDAEPMAGGTSEFFETGAIDLCTDATLPMLLRPVHTLVRPDPATLGLDTGFRKDPSAGVVVRSVGDLYVVAECVEIRPEPGKRLIPSVTIKQLLARGDDHRCSSVACDQHYVETVREHAGGVDLVEAPGGMPGKVETYTHVRTLLKEGKVRIPAGNKRLLSQLRQVVSKPTPGGGLTITSPRRAGAHGDLVSAFVIGLWAVSAAASADTQILRMVQGMRRMGVG